LQEANTILLIHYLWWCGLKNWSNNYGFIRLESQGDIVKNLNENRRNYYHKGLFIIQPVHYQNRNFIK